MLFDETTGAITEMCRRREGFPCEFVREKTSEPNCFQEVCKYCRRTGQIIYMCITRPGHQCEFREENAEEVCIHCGRIGKRILYTGQQKVFEHGDEKNLHADEGKLLGAPGTTLSREAFTSNVSNLGAGYKARDRTKDGIDKPKAKDVAIQKYRHKIEDYCAKIGLSGKSQEDCLELFDIIAASSKNGIPRSQVTPIILGVLFHGCKKGDLPFTVKNLAEKTGKDEKTVRAGMKLVEKKAKVFVEKFKVEASNLIEPNCRKLGMEKPFMNVFVPNAKTVDSKIGQFLEGKKPSTVAATDIYLTLKWFYSEESRWSMSAIANVVGISVGTLNNSVKDVLKEMESAGISSEDIVTEAKSLCR